MQHAPARDRKTRFLYWSEACCNARPWKNCMPFFFSRFESSPSTLPDASPQRVYARNLSRELFPRTACGTQAGGSLNIYCNMLLTSTEKPGFEEETGLEKNGLEERKFTLRRDHQLRGVSAGFAAGHTDGGRTGGGYGDADRAIAAHQRGNVNADEGVGRLDCTG